jgi:RHS repeat-associated protein
VPFLYVDYVNLDAEPGSGVVKYLFTNHLGVPERVEDESARTIWQGEVFPYGAIRVEVGSREEINLRFPGHYYDVETGLHYNRFRYYDPVLGCYLQCDPLGIAGGYNLYAYLANPLTGVDILGLTCKGKDQQENSDQSQDETKPRGNGRPEAGVDAGGLTRRESEDLAAAIAASRKAYDRAENAAKRLPRSMSDKTVASDGKDTLSGWTNKPPGYADVDPIHVVERSSKVGHDLRRAGGPDQVKNGGFPGQYSASHAEKQLTTASPHEPIGVSRAMCSDCQDFFSSIAEDSGKPQVVTDPEMTRVFWPDGSIDRIPR